MSRITTLEQLRRVIPEAKATTHAKILPQLDAQSIEFLAASPFALMATTRADGSIEVSPKGDAAGFARVEDPRTLLLPERAGNNLAFGLQNILDNGRVGMIFLRPGTGETLRLSGRAEILDDEALVAGLGSAERPALLAIRIRIERCYFHCARSVLRAGLWQPESWPAVQRVSFGRIIAGASGGDAAQAASIDARVQSGYTARLWSND